MEFYHANFNMLNYFLDLDIAHDGKGNFIRSSDFKLDPKTKEERIIFGNFIYRYVDELIISSRRLDILNYDRLNKEFKVRYDKPNCNLYEVGSLI